MSNSLVVAIVGMAGSGKSEVSNYLGSKGFPVIRFGQVVEDEVRRRGLAPNSGNERMVREDIRDKEGMNAIAVRSLLDIGAELAKKPMVVIDGLYSWSEYRTLKRVLGERLLVVLVFTSRTERYHRLQQRAKRRLTLQEAEDRDFTEIENIEKGGPIAVADYILLNDGSKKQLFAAADNLLAVLGVRPVVGDSCGTVAGLAPH